MMAPVPIDRVREVRTPVYCYDTSLLKETLETVRFHISDRPSWKVHYAVKANFNPGILKLIASAGLGADCVSGGEVRAALDAGFAPSDIVYAGVGKSDEEILLGLDEGISRFNVESVAELKVIDTLARSRGKVAPVSLRVNPDIGAHTHANITTGLAENKFGIYHGILPDVVRIALSLKGIEFKGLHFHIGSQILDMADFSTLCNRIADILGRLDTEGLPVSDINVGGGLGIDYYNPDDITMASFGAYFSTFKRHLRSDLPVHFELGRSIVGPCGSLVCKVLYVKEGLTRKFAVVDAGMTELIRPALYGAYHHIDNLTSMMPEEKYDVVGPICESSDVFGKARMLRCCRRGDYLAIRSAGAYGESMASSYNCRPLPGSILY
ncbi:MAG: diaminopimelate decarboxylase [Bacteroidales bacterium]|nr:diaminopimelate decarboxylase [Bacteroidales bacterium]